MLAWAKVTRSPVSEATSIPVAFLPIVWPQRHSANEK